jgi:pyridinium-3,5-biscarboxylic acid mononucleotide synthase
MSMPDRSRYSSDELLAHLQRALSGREAQAETDFARLDYGRGARIGTPEIILAENKPVDQVIEIIARMLDRVDRVLVSRVSAELADLLPSKFPDYNLEHPDRANVVRIAREDSQRLQCGGRVAIFTAGTSDLPRAEESRLVAEEMGCQVQIWADVGVAGLHRLIQPFSQAMNDNVGAIIVVAGMDGALPSVIAGLSPVPVIGLPSSVGYGYGGNGEAALMSMLQTCAPGLTVVNIDNSVGAGVAAGRIANQSAVDHHD